MTITRNQTQTNFSRFVTCAEESPEGCFKDAKEIRTAIGEIADSLLNKASELCLDACNCDGIYNLEVEIYGFLRQKNVDRFLGAEGYGKAFNVNTREMNEDMNRRLERDRDFLRDFHTYGQQTDLIEGLDMILETSRS